MHDRFIGLLAVVSMVVLTGCGGGDDPTGLGNMTPTNGTMSATVDGATWTALQIAPVNTSGTVAIGGSNASLIAIGFAFVGDTTGTYLIGPSYATSANVIENSITWSANSFQGSGVITVATLTAAGASGTFSFTAPLTSASGTPASRVVTSGQFDITF